MKTARQLAADLSKPGEDIVASLTATDAHLLHMGMALPGEVGELIDALKKPIIYGKTLDRANVIEELGDIDFYLGGIKNALNITDDEVQAALYAKLSKRYASGSFSNDQAQQRADKTPTPEEMDEIENSFRYVNGKLSDFGDRINVAGEAYERRKGFGWVRV